MKNNVWHVLPIDDIIPHEETTHKRNGQLPYSDCQCKPEHKDLENGAILIVHNSFDGREGLEWVNEILKPTNL